MEIEPFDDTKLDAIVRLSLRAWEPVFESLEKAMTAGFRLLPIARHFKKL